MVDNGPSKKAHLMLRGLGDFGENSAGFCKIRPQRRTFVLKTLSRWKSSPVLLLSPLGLIQHVLTVLVFYSLDAAPSPAS